jgi:DNA-binding XRE family transcriptional regulator
VDSAGGDKVIPAGGIWGPAETPSEFFPDLVRGGEIEIYYVATYPATMPQPRRRRQVRVPATELARQRTAAGLTQRELAQRLGVAGGTLSAIENGWRIPWPKLRADCARLLGIDEDILFPAEERGIRQAQEGIR